MRTLAIVAALSLIGCIGAGAPAKPPVATACADTGAHARDSLELVGLRLERDSAVASRRRQAGLTAGAQFAMLRYAKIVARDPSQSRFLVGWTRRAFDGSVHDTVGAP